MEPPGNVPSGPMPNVRSPNSVIFVRFMFPTKSMHHIRQGLRCNIIE